MYFSDEPLTAQGREFMDDEKAMLAWHRSAWKSNSTPLTDFPSIPSTPLPSHVDSGSVSPAWDPSSRTPGRLPDEEQIGPALPRELIKRPAGRPNRKDGYDLMQAAGLDNASYAEIMVRINDSQFSVTYKK